MASITPLEKSSICSVTSVSESPHRHKYTPGNSYMDSYTSGGKSNFFGNSSPCPNEDFGSIEPKIFFLNFEL